jgi:chromosome segregation ATPase
LRLFLVPTLTACLLSGAGCVSQKVQPEPSGAPSSKQGGGQENDAAEQLRKKRRELENSRKDLLIKRLAAQMEATSARNAVEAAERQLHSANLELENFSAVTRDLESAERTLGVDRSRQSLVEAQEELKELEEMYRQEDFAETTKELVLVRGRNRLEMATRGLDIARLRASQLEAHEHPKRERDLNEAVLKAGQALQEARARLEKLALEQELSLAKAQQGIEDLEREIAKLEAKGESPSAAK